MECFHRQSIFDILRDLSKEYSEIDCENVASWCIIQFPRFYVGTSADIFWVKNLLKNIYFLQESDSGHKEGADVGSDFESETSDIEVTITAVGYLFPIVFKDYHLIQL